MKLTLNLNGPPPSGKDGLMPDRPLPDKVHWIWWRGDDVPTRRGKMIAHYETHAIIPGASRMLCGMAKPAEYKGCGTQGGECPTCETMAAELPILTPDTEAQWWARYG